jgi:hypothetical protein
MPLILLIFLGLFEVPPPEIAPEIALAPGALTGTLTERGTRQAAVGVAVRLDGTPGAADAAAAGDAAEAFTDAGGRFAFPTLPPGVYRLVIDDPDYDGLTLEATVKPGAETQLEVRIERTALGNDGVRVVGRRARAEVVERHVSAETIRTLPGTNGDALKVVQSLPGASRVPFDGGDLVLRGGGWTRAYVEGHPILATFHFGGWRSVMSSSLIGDLVITPGNQGVAFGRGNGGVVEVKLRRPATEGLHGHAEADFYDAGAFLEGPLGPGSFALGVRRSYIDALLPLAGDDIPAFTTAPRYYDAQALYDLRLGRHDLRVFALLSSDAIVQVIEHPADSDASLRGGFGIETRFVSTQASWEGRFTDTLTHHLSVAVLAAREQIAIGEVLDLDLEYQIITARDHLDLRLVEGDDFALRVRGGIDLEIGIGKYTATGPPLPGAGRLVAPAGASEQIHASRSGVGFNHPAAWAEVEVRLGNLTLTPGVRVDHDGVVADTAVQPRLNARYLLRPGTALSAGVGRHAESIDFAQSERDLGNPHLDMERSTQVSAGVQQRLHEALTLDVTGFYKRLGGVIVTVDDPDVRLDNSGEGRAYGLELLLKHDRSGHFHGWLAYTLSRSEIKAGEDAPFAPFDLDQTHNLTLVAGWRFNTRWEAGLRWRYVTGSPYTAVERATFDADADVFVPGAGEYNGARLDAFHALDVRLDKHWIFDDWRLTTYLEAHNAYNRANPEGVEYAYDYRRSQTVVGLPVLPSFGVRGAF